MSKEYSIGFHGKKEPYLFCHKCGAKYLRSWIRLHFEEPYLNASEENYNKCYYCGNELNEEKFTIDDEFDDELVKKRETKLKRLQEYYDKKEKNNENIYIKPISTLKITCPYCKSENVKKIGSLSRLVSVGTLGLAGSKIGKQWHCRNCNSDF